MYDYPLEKDPNEESMLIRIEQLETFAKRLLDPEGFGHAVTGEVRDEVRHLFGMKRVES